MLDTLDDVTNVVAGTDTVKALNTSGHLQGTGCLEVDKTGTAGTTATVTRKFGIPQDLTTLLALVKGGLTIKARFKHADFSGFTQIALRIVYRFNSSGTPTIYDEYRLTSFTGAAWNTLSKDLSSPDSSTGSPTTLERSLCTGWQIVATKGTTATFADLLVDAIEIVPTGSGLAPMAVLILGAERVLLPPLNVFNRTRAEGVITNKMENAVEQLFMSGDELIEFGLKNARRAAKDTHQIHTLEEALRLAGQYMRGPGWGVAWPATELVDTTVATLNTALDTSLVVASSTEFAYLGDPAGLELRIGPNDSREVERVRLVSRSSTTLTLDRPLRFAHQVGTPVRSVGYYPNLAMVSGFPVNETGKAVDFNVKAIEAA